MVKELFTNDELTKLKRITSTFPGYEMTVYNATKEAIKQLKDAGLKGVSRRQRK